MRASPVPVFTARIVVSHMTMSLDRFIADPHDGVAELFGWYEAGPVTVPSADEHWSFKVDEGSAQMLREALTATGALVCGRRRFALRRARVGGRGRFPGRVSAEQGPGELVPGIEELIEGGVHVPVANRQ